jgi:hypothetical protein
MHSNEKNAMSVIGSILESNRVNKISDKYIKEEDFGALRYSINDLNINDFS